MSLPQPGIHFSMSREVRGVEPASLGSWGAGLGGKGGAGSGVSAGRVGRRSGDNVEEEDGALADGEEDADRGGTSNEEKPRREP
jgi:hypothetical protein